MADESISNEGDFMCVTTCETPTEAHLLKETLIAAGLAAEIADANFVQANLWMSAAVGGVRVLVPTSIVTEARATVAAFNAGAFQLEADLGAGDVSPETSEGSGLRTYQIYRHSTRKPAVMAVKQGFSWGAFIIGPFWFLLNGMWLTFLLSASFTWGTPLVMRAFDDPGNPDAAGIQIFITTVFFAIWGFTGWVANFLLGEELKRKGYVLGPAVLARSAGDAISAARGAA